MATEGKSLDIFNSRINMAKEKLVTLMIQQQKLSNQNTERKLLKESDQSF